jgi:cytochrome c oxidase subunit 4
MANERKPESMSGSHPSEEPHIDAVVNDHSLHADVPGAAHDAAHDDHNSPENIAREVRIYYMIFGSLAVLTGITVAACYFLELPLHYAIAVGLTIACIKGFLVAGFFMHLMSEKKLIYSVLILTVVFFIFLILIPLGTMHSRLGS